MIWLRVHSHPQNECDIPSNFLLIWVQSYNTFSKRAYRQYIYRHFCARSQNCEKRIVLVLYFFFICVILITVYFLLFIF